MKKKEIIAILSLAMVLTACGPGYSGSGTPGVMTPQQEDTDSRESETSDLWISYAKVFDGYLAAEERMENPMAVARDDTQGDISEKIDGYSESSLKGKTTVQRVNSDDASVHYEIYEDGQYVLSTPDFEKSIYYYQYLQMADMDYDGTEEILIADYTNSTTSFKVGVFYVYKKADGQWKLFAQREGSIDGDGNVDNALKTFSKFDKYSYVEDVALTSGGIRVIVDRYEKIYDVYGNVEVYELDIKSTDTKPEIIHFQAKEFFTGWKGTYTYENATTGGAEGTLIIKEDAYSNWIDISDYMGDDSSSYRFLASSANCEAISDNKAYVAYPENVRDDGATYSYYVFEKTDTGISVYFSDKSYDDAELIYSARRCSEEELALSEEELKELSELLSDPEISKYLTKTYRTGYEADNTDFSKDSEEVHKYKCLSGTKSGPFYSVRMEDQDFEYYTKRNVFCFGRNGGSIVPCSNSFVSEDEASAVFDVALSQYSTSECSVMVFDGFYAVVTVDGFNTDHVIAEYDGVTLNVVSAQARDVNSDGFDDLVLTSADDTKEFELVFLFNSSKDMFEQIAD